MKYTIEGFSQIKLIEFGLNSVDALILRWYVDFLPKMSQVMHNGIPYTWVKYQAVIDDLPCIEITNKQVIARRFDKFIAAGIMEKYVNREMGVFTCFRLTQKYLELVSTANTPINSKVEGLTQKLIGIDSKVDTPINSKVDTKDSSININSSINTPSPSPLHHPLPKTDDARFSSGVDSAPEGKVGKKMHDGIFENWKSIAKSANIEFTKHEWSYIQHYAIAPNNLSMPPHMIRTRLNQLEKWANENLDIVDSLLNSTNTRTLIKPNLVTIQDNAGNRIYDRNILTKIRADELKQNDNSIYE